jgi:predicted DNA binding CopG/RHH family protein
MKKNEKKIFMPLDQEEKKLMESLENDTWASVPDLQQDEIAVLAAARNTLKKEKRINLRLTEKDYQQVKIKAIEEGLPYQTLISSIVHKYLNGTLTQRL